MPSHWATPPTLYYFETVLLSYPAWPWAHPVFSLGGRQRWRLLSLGSLTTSCTKARAVNIEVWMRSTSSWYRAVKAEKQGGHCWSMSTLVALSCLSYTFWLWYKTRDSLMKPPRNHSVCKTMDIFVEFSVVRSRTGKTDKHWVPPPHLGTPGGCEVNHFRSYSQVWEMMTMWKYTSYKPCDTQLFHVNRYVMWTK